ncbi:hypothetical protein Dcar01_03519 [Deinococcus carri]|uniref:Peptidase M15B domain-containing protein n=1 Tax=Deinococcus carri TaxID=1211323 RepID=A0ABP9WDW2_9DEIO
MSTAQDRDPNHLHQLYRTPLEHWLADARAWGKPRGIEVCVYETFRTAERQAWLYAQGRTRPGPVVTYTLDSSHEYGLAADWVPLRLVGERWVQDWSHATYNAIYAAVPPARYGLETFPWERPHLQLAGVNGPKQNISGSVWAAAHGIRANVIVGSIWPLRDAPVTAARPPSTTPASTTRRRVFLRGQDGKNTTMDVPAVVYGGQLITRLEDGRVQVGTSILTVYQDGALQLDRAKT